MAARRWLQRRFDGAVVRTELPAGVLDALAARAKLQGMRVEEETAESQRSYRTAPTGRVLRLEPADRKKALWVGGRVWQDGPRVLRYEGWQRGTKWQSWVAFFIVPINLLCREYLPPGARPLLITELVFFLVLLLALYVSLRFEARGTSRWIHDFLEGEVIRAQGAVRFRPNGEPPAMRVAPEDEAKTLQAAAKRGE